MIEELAARIWEHRAFHQEVATLREQVLRKRYVPEASADLIGEELFLRLLRSAAVLSASSHNTHKQLAYQIATSAAELVPKEFVGAYHVLLVVLSRLGNFPALAYAKRRFEISEESLPVRPLAEAQIRAQNNSIILAGRNVALTDFQASLWKHLINGEPVGVSAPTSAGKSFILQAYAERMLSEGLVRNIAFLVPTRALINQVSDDVSKWLVKDISSAELITTPVAKETSLPSRAVYVVTQERMQLLQNSHPELSFDLMLVDEAQGLGDGPRGVLLSSVIEEALDRNSIMQVLLAGPNLNDPGSLGRAFGQKPVSVSTSEASVSQNIIFVDTDEVRPSWASLALYAEGKKNAIGVVDCGEPLLDHNSKLINIALRLGGEGQSLIYALGPSECEEIAFGLSDVDVIDAEELGELSNFIKEAVHEKYQLAQSVLKRVGYHYGRQPSLVRKAIEDAFSEGRLKYLVTTSTLLYGVNLPAQNLFLHNPERGKGQPVNSNDFWNLAGRAGRMGKEFSGNIFLIDYGSWPTDPMSGDKDVAVTSSIEQHVVHRQSELIDYINDPGRVPDRNKPDELENTFVKLVKDYMEGKLESGLKKIGLDVNSSDTQRLVGAIENSVLNTDITIDTLSSSPTVSIHRQQALYDRLSNSLKRKGPAYIIPKHPRDSNAYNSYVAAIRRCHGEILKYPASDKSDKYYALIALRWMKGEPLPRIIDESYDYKLRQKQSPNYSTVIRTVLSEIENDLRFKYVRLFSCYNAVLELLLRNENMEELLPAIPSIPMYLEVGACSPTMISFMGMGLSRFTAAKLGGIVRRQNMSQLEARSWVKGQNLDALNLPMASIREIRRLIVG